MHDKVVGFIRDLYKEPNDVVPLHSPKFIGNEKEYLNACIDSTFVSSVGKFVDQFENKICDYTGSGYAIATVNGTCALQLALRIAGVEEGDLVITQPLTFIATVNAIKHAGASPVFLDIDQQTLGLSGASLEQFIVENTESGPSGKRVHKETGKIVAACLPMHSFGHPVDLNSIVEICTEYNLALIEDAAESMGSTYNGMHTGTFGKMGVISFNGNKTITCGGGGMILTDDQELFEFGKHLSTQAKVDHPWEFKHDNIGYNYRMPNINAAIGCAQLESLDILLASKREIAQAYKEFFANTDMQFVQEPKGARSNYWLNTVLMKNEKEKNEFLEYSNNHGIMARPAWNLIPEFSFYSDDIKGSLENAKDIASRLICLPSSPIVN
jgi:aminotransferase in exopolysaccharide biosynthesis